MTLQFIQTRSLQTPRSRMLNISNLYKKLNPTDYNLLYVNNFQIKNLYSMGRTTHVQGYVIMFCFSMNLLEYFIFHEW